MKPLQRFSVGAALGLSVLAAPVYAETHSELLMNNDFAEGFKGWQTMGGPLLTSPPTGKGSRGVSFAKASLEQTVRVIAGDTYRIAAQFEEKIATVGFRVLGPAFSETFERGPVKGSKGRTHTVSVARTFFAEGTGTELERVYFFGTSDAGLITLRAPEVIGPAASGPSSAGPGAPEINLEAGAIAGALALGGLMLMHDRRPFR